MSAARPPLADHHRELLHDSAISDAVIEQRGYRTAWTRSRLEDLGFKSYQRSVPALIVPCLDVDGTVLNYQSRPDEPRIDAERGRPVKYETPGGTAAVLLDVPPASRAHIGTPTAALWVTEGCRKADSLATAGACSVAVLGVQMFRTDRWDRVALEDRTVVIAYDSDARCNPNVHKATMQLAALLTERGALVKYLQLPQDQAGKLGVDDYLALGHDLEDLWGLVADELPPLPTGPPPTALPTLVLLNQVDALLRRYVSFPTQHHSRALALWILHTWAFESAAATPYMALVSAEKRSGKTRALEVLELAAREPLRAASISAAGVFQAVEKWTPTLLIDEVDATFVARSEQAEALRGILNAGNRRGSYVVRGTQEGEPRRFAAFCPKALSGINANWPDTVVDRSIVLEMQRKKAGQDVHDFFPSEIEGAAVKLRADLADWAQVAGDALAEWRRAARIPGLTDRQQEAWDPLLAIAEHAGGPWPQVAADAARAFARAAERVTDESHGNQLLVALAAMFEHTRELASKDLCVTLNENEELPFGAMRRGEGVDPRGIARILRPYGIRPRDVWVDGASRKGYRREDFDDAWARYAPRDTLAEVREKGEVRENPPTEPKSPRGYLADDADAREPSARPIPPQQAVLADLPDLADSEGEVADAHVPGEPGEGDYAARFRRDAARGAWGRNDGDAGR